MSAERRVIIKTEQYYIVTIDPEDWGADSTAAAIDDFLESPDWYEMIGQPVGGDGPFAAVPTDPGVTDVTPKFNMNTFDVAGWWGEPHNGIHDSIGEAVMAAPEPAEDWER